MCISTSGRFMVIPELSKMITLSSDMITRARGPIRIEFFKQRMSRAVEAKEIMDFQWIAMWHFGDCTKFAKSQQNLMTNHEIEIVMVDIIGTFFHESIYFSEQTFCKKRLDVRS